MKLPSVIAPQPVQSMRQPRPISFFEFWPDWMFYTPVVIYWLIQGLRHLSWSLPTAANPRITTGGLCGESKLSILNQVGPDAENVIAPAIGVLARPDGTAAAEAAMRDAGLDWPVVAKPYIGCNGTGVRLLRDRAGLDLKRGFDAFRCERADEIGAQPERGKRLF